MLARVFSACLAGIEATVVRVEVDVARGLPAFATVGLPDAVVRESRERVRSALKNSGFDFPQERITVNLAPAGLRKEGGSFDLPIALGLLAATGAVKRERLDGLLVAGELALDGSIHAVRGILPMALAARRAGLAECLLPAASAAEAAVVDGLAVYAVPSLAEAAAFLDGELALERRAIDADGLLGAARCDEADFTDVRGQPHAKRALEIAAAGAHNVLMLGPPGTGKTMLARRLPTILPPLGLPEALEVTAVWSVAGQVPGQGLVTERPFRAPHHTASYAGLIGGGPGPRPGEVSLAHHGVLFLDELPRYCEQAYRDLPRVALGPLGLTLRPARVLPPPARRRAMVRSRRQGRGSRRALALAAEQPRACHTLRRVDHEAGGTLEGDPQRGGRSEAAEALEELGEARGGVGDGPGLANGARLFEHTDGVRGGGPVQADEERHCAPPWDCETLPRERSCRSLTDRRSGLQLPVALHPVAGWDLSWCESGERVSPWRLPGKRTWLSPTPGMLTAVTIRHARPRHQETRSLGASRSHDLGPTHILISPPKAPPLFLERRVEQ